MHHPRLSPSGKPSPRNKPRSRGSVKSVEQIVSLWFVPRLLPKQVSWYTDLVCLTTDCDGGQSRRSYHSTWPRKVDLAWRWDIREGSIALGEGSCSNLRDSTTNRVASSVTSDSKWYRKVVNCRLEYYNVTTEIWIILIYKLFSNLWRTLVLLVGQSWK